MLKEEVGFKSVQAVGQAGDRREWQVTVNSVGKAQKFGNIGKVF